MSQNSKALIGRLIRKYSDDSGTESLLGYVASTNGMLSACEALVEGRAQGDTEFGQWLVGECERCKVNQGALLKSVMQILDILGYQNGDRNHYSVLGLSSEASIEEVKKAYRKLSLAHHPDRAVGSVDKDPTRFIQISKAYRAITESDSPADEPSSPAPNPDWNSSKKRKIGRKERRELSLWLIGLLLGLVIVSVIGTINFRKRAMITGLKGDQESDVVTVEQSPNLSGNDNGIDGVGSGNSGENQISAGSQRSLASAEGHLAVSAGEDRVVLTKKSLSKEAGGDKGTQKWKSLGTGPEKLFNNNASGDGSAASDSLNQQPDKSRLFTSDLAQQEQKNRADLGETEKQVLVTSKTSTAGQGEANLEIGGGQDGSVPRLEPEESLRVFRKDEGTTTESLIPVVEGRPQKITGSDQPTQAVNPTASATEPQAEVQRMIDKFIEEYEFAYSQRNIALFSSFFHSEATENDKPFSEMVPVYKKLFRQTSDVSLKLKILTWKDINEYLYLSGRFSVNLNYINQEDFVGSGRVSIVLQRSAENPLVKSMIYEFDK